MLSINQQLNPQMPPCHRGRGSNCSACSRSDGCWQAGHRSGGGVRQQDDDQGEYLGAWWNVTFWPRCSGQVTGLLLKWTLLATTFRGSLFRFLGKTQQSRQSSLSPGDVGLFYIYIWLGKQWRLLAFYNMLSVVARSLFKEISPSSTVHVLRGYYRDDNKDQQNSRF